MKPRFSKFLMPAICLAIAGTLFAPPRTLSAQTKYNPDDPEVEKIVRPMMKYIETNFKGGSLGRRVLLAVAIVEATKRYDQIVPRDHPIVVEACHDIRKELQEDDWFGSSEEFNTMYGPCLCLILLCIIDKEKYDAEIKALMAFIDDRQEDHGPWGYRSERTVGDTSQVQYVSLAAWVADKHGFKSEPRWGTGILDWLHKTQRGPNYQPGDGNGGWGYKDGNTGRTTQSITAAGASSVYLISDWFGLSPVAPAIKKRQNKDSVQLPRDVALFVRRDSKINRPDKVKVRYDVAKLNKMKSGANAWFGRNFAAKTDWNYYFLYAFERFAYFRENAEGPLSGKMKNWYDQGVERIVADTRKNGDGSTNVPGGPLAESDTAVNSALAVLFLVRSTEILDLGIQRGQLVGNEGFAQGELKKRGNRWIGEEIERDLEELITLIDNPNSKEDLDRIMNSFKKFKPLSGDKDSKAKLRARVRGLVTHQKYGPRYVGVRYLSGIREMENVPALIYALSDPAPDIALMAHNGLRFISRKIDSISLASDPKAEDFLKVKKQWEEWYLSVQPDGELLDK